MVVWGDNIHDDTKALQAYINGEAKLIHPDGSPGPGNRTYLISKPLTIKKSFYGETIEK